MLSLEPFVHTEFHFFTTQATSASFFPLKVVSVRVSCCKQKVALTEAQQEFIRGILGGTNKSAEKTQSQCKEEAGTCTLQGSWWQGQCD